MTNRKVNMQKTLPKGWKWVRLGDIASREKFSIRMGPFGSQLKKHELVNEGIKVLWIENIVDNEFNWLDNKCITQDKFKQLKGFEVKPNDILTTTMGTIGRTCVVPSNIGKAIISSHLLKITPDLSLVSPTFVAKYISSEPAVRYFDKKAHGIVMKGLNTSIIRNMPFPLPPLKVQHKIVEILEEADNLRKLRQQADEKMKDLIPSLFVQMFGDPVKNPKGWKVKTLGDITERVTAQIFPTDLADTEFFYIGLEHIESNTGVLINANHQKGEDIKSNKNKFEAGDVLYGKLRPYLNKVWLADRNGICSTDIWVLRPFKKVTTGYFISTFLKFQSIVSILNLKTEGANLPRVKAISFDKVPAPLPPLPLQQKFAKLVEDIEAEKQRQAESRKKLDELFQSLMQRAFTGELAA